MTTATIEIVYGDFKPSEKLAAEYKACMERLGLSDEKFMQSLREHERMQKLLSRPSFRVTE